MAEHDPRIETVQHLARQLQRMQRGGRSAEGRERSVSTGIAPLDAFLPAGGLKPGSLVEWLAEGPGSGAGTLVYRVAASVTREEGNVVVIDPDQEFYPPAAHHLGLDLQRTIVVQPAGGDDALWAWEQSLRCSGVTVAAGLLGQFSDRAFRRLQLAAEVGGGIGLMIRPARFLSQPSWADIRLRVVPLPLPSAVDFCRRLRVELVRSREQVYGRSIELELHDEKGFVRLVAELGSAKDPRRASGAG